MLHHTFLLIYRNFKRFKTTFFINLIGLSTGLACTLLIYLWVNDELNIDKFHQHDSRLFQVMESQQHATGIRVTNSTPWLLAEALTDEMPEVEYAVTATPTYWSGKLTLTFGDKTVKASGQYTGKDYFNIFSFDLIHGDKNQVLTSKNSIVISEDLAHRLFNTTDNVLGKAIEFQHQEQYQVTGIFKNLPQSSSAKFDFVLSCQVLIDKEPQVAKWENSGPKTYVLFKDGVDPGEFTEKISGFIKTKSKDTHRTLFIQKFSDVYLHGGYKNGIQSGGRIEYVVQFSVIAFFILIIACINFMNLSTAKASRRIKEVGIKKAVGAGRRTLITQYLSESMFMSFLSLAVSILLVDLFLPQFNQITGKQLTLNFNTELILSVFAIVLLTGFIAGSYPALYLSGFNPVTVLKGKLNTSLGEQWARKGLVIFQFAISVILIVSVLIVYRQIQFVQQKNLGYNKDNVIYFDIEGRIKEHLETFLEEVKKVQGVTDATSVAQSMVGGGNTTDISWEGKDPQTIIPFAFRPVNYGAIEMLDLKLIDGSSFSRAAGTDSMKVIFNETGIEAMGIQDPVGKTITLGPYQMPITGVVKNFHFESLHTDVGPMFFILAPKFTQKVMVKLEGGDVSDAISGLQKFYQQFNPGFTFDYRFLDQDYQAQYASEQRVASLSKYFSTLAILISCLGLFGLAAFTAERRLKEIGIRKVLGLSEFGIVYLLTRDFTRIVFMAIVIALPISYYLTKDWLSGFAYKIPLEWWYFITAGVLALMIAWLTVGAHAIRAARVNPTQCLKDE